MCHTRRVKHSTLPHPAGTPSFRVLLVGALWLASLSAGAVETLENAWEIGLRHDRPVQMATQQHAASQEFEAAAESARWPGLQISASYTRLSEAPEASASLPQLPLPLPLPSSLSLPLSKDRFQNRHATLTLPLYTSGRISHAIEAARASVEVAAADLRRTRQDSKLAIAKAYLNVLRAQQLALVANQHLSSLLTHQHDVQAFFAQGLVAKADTLAVTVAVADAQQRQIQASNAVDLASAAYNRQLQRPLATPVTLAETQFQPEHTELAQLQHLAQQQRAELDQLKSGSTAMTAQARAVRSADGPQLALIGGYHHLDNPYLKQDTFRSLSLGLSWDIFDGGVNRHQAAALQARASALQLQRDEVQSFIELQVREAWQRQQEALQRKQVAQATLAYAEENLKVAKDRYANSLAPQSEVLDAETRRAGALGNLHNAHYDEQQAILQLRHAVGNL
ncbi:outer membrane protein TolC [Chitinivorax tropicus]|uniref:Outer membrane protein TolC n=1 Tax=Chitinivorax tropicus TaxID=714531 RepID=A0A840MJB8_9PROT|nr:TolC family protein [Chitinivorax tropicus]MBB5016772.1 outer membrane protein TolC [Chitinivorax tropicus]